MTLAVEEPRRAGHGQQGGGLGDSWGGADELWVGGHLRHRAYRNVSVCAQLVSGGHTAPSPLIHRETKNAEQKGWVWLIAGAPGVICECYGVTSVDGLSSMSHAERLFVVRHFPRHNRGRFSKTPKGGRDDNCTVLPSGARDGREVQHCQRTAA